jgi:integrase
LFFAWAQARLRPCEKTKDRCCKAAVRDLISFNSIPLNGISQSSLPLSKKDTCIFCCFIGLVFLDVKSITKDNLMIIDVITWLYKTRITTDEESQIRLSAVLLKLIEKYKYNTVCISKGTLFPVFSNQKMNAYMKEIADLCGIKKHLTINSARHTFVTTDTIANNMSIESLSKMLSHESIKMTHKYSRIVDKLMKEDMSKL